MHLGRAINMRTLFRSVVCLQARACPVRETEVRRIRFYIQRVGKSRLTKCATARRNFPELIRSHSPCQRTGGYKIVHRKRMPINMSLVKRKSMEKKMTR